MKIVPLALPEVLLITPKRFGDERGFFSETWNRQALCEAGITHEFVQDNHSLSRLRGTVRGLHFQTPPYAQAKLVRVVRGVIFDVAVDLRHDSSTCGQWVAAELSDENWQQLYIPAGFAHGFCTLTADAEVCYKTSAPYAPAHDAGIHWQDPVLAIDWPINPQDATLSAKDAALPAFATLGTVFGPIPDPVLARGDAA
jgi:dTDP-4-dehydrorhamnose 3,5-epimerase